MVKLTMKKKIILAICIIILVYVSYKLYKLHHIEYREHFVPTEENIKNIMNITLDSLVKQFDGHILFPISNGFIKNSNYTLIKNDTAFFLIVTNPYKPGTYLISAKLHSDGFKLNSLYSVNM